LWHIEEKGEDGGGAFEVNPVREEGVGGGGGQGEGKGNRGARDWC
jgi:hypothetical protein